MSVIRKISQWAARTGGAFLRGGVQQQAEEPEYELNQGVTEAYAAADPAAREKIDPFNHGNGKYGGRQVYRCREDREREEAEKAAQEAAAQQQYMQEQAAQYQQQYAQEQYAQEQMQQTAAYQAQQYQQAQQQYAQEQMQQTAAYQAQQYQQAQQQYVQEQMQQTAAYQAQQYQQAQQQYAQEQMQQTAAYQAQRYQQAQQQYAQEQMQQTAAYQAQQYQQAQQQYAQEQAAYQAQQYQQPQQYAQEQAAYQNQQAQASNVVTFPGMHTGADGRVYAHVEYIIQMSRRQDCRQIIEYIRANASVFLNMETINAAERQRCVDMLSGAAFALGCRLHKISHGGIYLISSPSVQVMADNATQMLSDPNNAKNFARQRYEEPAQSRPERTEQQPEPAAEAVPDSMPVDSRQTGFSSGSPTTRFRSQGSHSLSASYGTVAAGTYSGTFPAVNAH